MAVAMMLANLRWAVAVLVFAASLAADAQAVGKVYRIGYLSLGSASGTYTRPLDALRQGLRELGWVEGQNIVIEYRYGEGRSDALSGLANQLIGLGVDVIVASPTPAALAAKNATQTIPIVGIGFDNPVQHGLIASLARPGGNVTGISYAVGPEIFGKDLGLLRELVPGLRTVAVLSNPDGVNHGIIVGNIETAARTLGIKLLIVEVRRPEEFEAAFATIAAGQAESIFVVGDPMYGVHQARLRFVLVHEREGRAGDAHVGTHAERFGQRAREKSFAGAERAVEQQQVSADEQRRELDGQARRRRLVR